MFYNAKNETITLHNKTFDTIRFGNGKKVLIIIPGVGDGLKTVKGLSLPFAYLYRLFTKEYTVYSFSRTNELTQGYTTEQMADDLKELLDFFHLEEVDVVGVSQGGMIAQWLAIKYPTYVHKLVLVVTSSRPNLFIDQKIHEWIDYAKNNDYKQLMLDTTLASYSDSYIQRMKVFLPLLTIFGKPKSFDRFIIQAESCLSHNTYHQLKMIQCPTLIIGGKQDKIVGVNASIELAKKILNSELYLYEEYGHALYDEAKDFNQRVVNFLYK